MKGEKEVNFYKLPHGCVRKETTMKLLFTLCWIAYVTTYLGRLNYAACLVEIVNAEGWTKSMAGLIATGFFITYGCGQIVNGFVGDRISPKIMVAIGLSISGLVNFLFPTMHSYHFAIVLWCINGFAQSMIWSPLIRLLSEWLPAEKRLKACVNMNGTVPVGTLAVYGLSASLVYLGNWKWVFYTSGTILIIMALIWLKGIGGIEKNLDPVEDVKLDMNLHPQQAHRSEHTSFLRLAMMSAMPFICIALFMQGMLKDGVTTWIPTFLEENFGLSAAAAILSTTIVPIINLGGVYFASYINGKVFKNEVFTAMVFFMVGLTTLLLLTFANIHSVTFSLLLLAATTTFMMGINTLLASMTPSYYVRFGVTATVTGVLNASAYLGSAVSSYGNGAIVENFGWNTIMYCWCISAVVGVMACFIGATAWKKFRTESKRNEYLSKPSA